VFIGTKDVDSGTDEDFDLKGEAYTAMVSVFEILEKL